jgi:methylphosphotriester-DNA--protein-cysteine methyltransferase
MVYMSRQMPSSNASHMYQTSHARWNAISRRDAAAHCSFIYGVKTTRIYCRPTCTARLARRANVVYYDTIDQAQKDGFRACQKCKPDDVAFFGQREEVVVSALEILRTKQNEATMKWSLKELAKEVGVTPSYLCRVFKTKMGITIGEYMRQFEMQPNGLESLQSPGTTDSSIVSSECQTPNSDVVPTRPTDDYCYVQSTNPTGQNVAIAHVTTSVDTPVVSRPPDATSPFGLASRLEPCSRNEEAFDLNFDFDEWVWTEGFNFEDWVLSPNTFDSSRLP